MSKFMSRWFCACMKLLANSKCLQMLYSLSGSAVCLCMPNKFSKHLHQTSLTSKSQGLNAVIALVVFLLYMYLTLQKNIHTQQLVHVLQGCNRALDVILLRKSLYPPCVQCFSSLKHAKLIIEVLMTLVLFWNKLELFARFWSFPFSLSLLMACCKVDTQNYL